MPAMTSNDTASTLDPTAAFPQVTWFEVHTADPSGATAFYGELFGWTFEPLGAGYHGYQLISQGEGAAIGGGVADTGGQGPATVIPCVQVPDVAATAARAVELGGTVVVEPDKTPAGLTFAYVADRDGSVFGVWCPPPGG